MKYWYKGFKYRLALIINAYYFTGYILRYLIEYCKKWMFIIDSVTDFSVLSNSIWVKNVSCLGFYDRNKFKSNQYLVLLYGDHESKVVLLN